MSESTLSPPMVYECNDIEDDKFPIESIKYCSITVTPLVDLSLLLKMQSLEVCTFRLCSLTFFPDEFFALPKIKSIDLSGNMLETIPNTRKWASMTSLVALDVSDNNIMDLMEFTNLVMAPNLRQLNITGNVCQSANNSVNRLVTVMPKLDVINDTIILSQHRAALENLSIDDKQGIIPLSKTDEFFFKFARYMRGSVMDRYAKRFNAEMFCLNCVIRKYSFVVKIQSVFRGFVKRMEYKKKRRSAIKIQRTVKKWYRKRVDAANKIKQCYREMIERKKIKFENAVKLTQRLWRSKMARDKAIEYLFMPFGKTEFYILRKTYNALVNFCKEGNFVLPKVTEDNKYRILDVKEPKNCNLPGFPNAYYPVDCSLNLRRIQNNEIPKNYSLWCKHDHDSPTNINVNASGINKQSKCLFGSLHPIAYQKGIKNVTLKDRNDSTLLLCSYDNYKDFIQMFRKLREVDNNEIRLIPVRNAESTAAILTIQNAMRTIIVRRKNINDIKSKILKNRAYDIILHFIKFVKGMKHFSLILKIKKFMNHITNVSYFYIKEKTLLDLEKMTAKPSINFGYNIYKELVLAPDQESSFFTEEIPQEEPTYKECTFSSLIKSGSSIISARSSMFDDERITKKFLERYRIKRVSFTKVTEAKTRALILALVLHDTTWYLTEKDITKLISATRIQDAWLGHTSRARLYHMSAQLGRQINTKCFIFRSDFEKERSMGVINVKYDRAKYLRENMDVRDQISQLRGDYKPWVDMIDNYKKQRAKTELENKKNKNKPTIIEVQREPSTSKKMIGLVKSFEPTEEPVPHQSMFNSPRVEKVRSQTTHAAKRPTTAKDIKKIVDFQTSTINNFATPILDQALGTPKSIFTRPQTTMEKNVKIRPQAKPQIIAKRATPVSTYTTTQPIYQPINREKTPRRIGVTPNANKTKKLQPMDANSTMNQTNKVSSQITDNRQAEIVKETFTRLAHLIQITETVFREQIVDNSIEEKRQATVRARTAMAAKRYEMVSNAEEKNNDIRARSHLERDNRIKNAEKIKNKTLEQRIVSAKNIRHDHKKNREKYQKDILFAQKFVSTTRQLAQKCEARHMKAESRKLREAANEAVLNVRNAEIESRIKYEEDIKLNKEKRVQTAKLDRTLLDEKKEINRQNHESRLDRLSELKQDLKETMRAVTEMRERGVHYMLPNMTETVQEDDIEATAASLDSIIGGNLGYEESHLLVGMLANLL